MLTSKEQEILDGAPDWAECVIQSKNNMMVTYAKYNGCCCALFLDNNNGEYAYGLWTVIHNLADLRKKQGKTVWDAVNYFEGEMMNHTRSEAQIFYSDAGYNIGASGILICTIEEFNQCVDGLSKYANKKVGCHSPHTDYNYEQHKKDYAQPKPRTKVEYVKVDKDAEGGAYWECARDFAENEVNLLVARTNPEACCVMSWMNISDNDELLRQYKEGKIYRKVEREITWQDEVIEFCGKKSIKIGAPFDSKNQYYDFGRMTEGELIEISRLVHNATK